MSADEQDAKRQRALVAALWPGGGAARLETRESGERAARALAAYRANARASAERALAAAYPTVQQLLGAESFAQLAAALWQAQPPERGDLAWFGAGLPEFIAASPQLAGERYLADVARLDFAVHRAGFAADGSDGAPDLQPLAEHDPERLRLRLAPGSALLSSRYPVFTIWQAHRDGDFEAARAALAGRRAEHALVLRCGWRVDVALLADGEARFAGALLQGATLAAALDRGGEAFEFAAWLARALRGGWLDGVAVEPAAR